MYGPVLICQPGVAELPGTAVALLLPLLLSALWQWPGQHDAAVAGYLPCGAYIYRQGS